MSEAVDTRVVEARFDSKQFEKGVDKTVKKLDELKKSLNMKETGKSVAELANKTSEATEKASNSLEKLQERFTTFTGMLKQKILSGIADDIVGALMNMKHAFENFVTSISTAQISQGMAKYEQILTSVRTMISAGQSQEAAYTAIDKLKSYTDQTSYSLTQMTDAMSKMVAAGVDLETATRNVEGIANACATAGINATDAQRAFFNLAQAYGKGTLNYTDYKSLELLNMTTASFKQQMLDAAVAAGTLVKTYKKVKDEAGNWKEVAVYKTSNKKDKKVKAGKNVTMENLSEMLRYDFMNKEALNQLFGGTFSFDEETWQEAKKKYGYDDIDIKDKKKRAEVLELIKKEYGEVAVSAYLAAREARSFNDVINTIKDAVSTGWAQTFEYLFGKLDEAKEFFTWLTESNLAQAIYAVGEWRNAILKVWSESGGRDSLLEGLQTIDALLGDLLEKLGLLGNDFEDDTDAGYAKAQNIGQALATASDNFREFAEDVRFWFNQVIDEDTNETRLDKIVKIIGVVGDVFSGLTNALRIGFTFIKNLVSKFEPTFTALGDVFAKLGGSISDVFKPFDEQGNQTGAYQNLQNGLENILTVVEKLLTPLPDIIRLLGDVGGFFLDMGLGTITMNIQFFSDALGLLLEVLGIGSAQQKNGTGVMEGIGNDIRGFGEACKDAFGAVNEFFGLVLDELRKLLGINNEADGQEEGGFFSNIINWFNTSIFVANVRGWIDDAILDIGEFIQSIPERISQFAMSAGDFIHGLFYTKETKYNGSMMETKEVETPLKQWLDQAILDVKEFIASIPSKLKKIPSIISTFIQSIFGDKTTRLDGAKTDELTGRTKNVVIKNPLNRMLDNIVLTIKNFIKTLPTRIAKAVQTAGGFLRSIVSALFGNEYDEDKIQSEVEGKISKPFENLSISSILTSIQNVGTEILNQIASIFTGSGNVEVNQKWFADKVANGLNWITTKADEVWKTVSEWFADLPNKIANIFKNDTSAAEGENSTIGSSISRFAQKIGDWITSIPDTLLTFYQNASKGISDLWTMITDALTGKESKKVHGPEYEDILENYGQSAADYYDKQYRSRMNPILYNVKKFIKHLGSFISEEISKLPTNVVEGINLGANLIGNVMESLTKWLTDRNLEKKMTDESGNITDVTAKAFSDMAKDENASPLVTALSKLGETLRDLITITIPSFIVQGFTYIQTNYKSWLTALANALGIEGKDWSEVKKNIGKWGDKIAGYIREIPDKIRKTIGQVKNTLNTLFKGNSFSQETYDNILREGGYGAAERYKDATTNPIIDFFKNIGGAVVDVFRDLGPDILDGIKTAIGWLRDNLPTLANQAIESIRNLFGGDKKEEKVSTENIDNAAEAIENYVETAQTAEKETKGMDLSWLNPMNWFIGTAKGEEITDEKKAENAFSGANALVGGLGDFLGGLGALATTKTGETIAFLVAVSVVIYHLKEIFSLSDELYSLSRLAITAVFAGVVAVLAQIVYLASQTDQTKFNRVMSFMNNLITLAEVLGSVFVVYKALSLGKEIVGLKDDINKTKTALGGTKTSGFFTLINALSNLLTVGVGIDVASHGIETVGDSLSESITEVGIAVDTVTSMIGPAVEKLAGLGSKAAEAVDTLPKLRELFSELINFLATQIVSDKTGTSNDTAAANELEEEIATETNLSYRLDDRLKWIYAISSVLNELSTAIEVLNHTKNPQKNMRKAKKLVESVDFREFFSAVINTVYYLAAADTKVIEAYSELPAVGKVGEIIRAMADALSIFSVSIDGISSDSLTAVKETFEIMKEFAQSVGSEEFLGKSSFFHKLVFGDSNLSAFGRVLSSFGANMKSFFDSIDKINFGENNEHSDVIRNKLSLALTAATRLATIVDKFNLQNVTSSKVKTIGEYVGDINGLGTKLMVFFSEIHGYESETFGVDSFDFIFNALDAVEKFKNTIMTSVSYFENAPDKMDYIADALIGKDGKSGFFQRISDAFDGSKFNPWRIQEFTDILKNLSFAIEQFTIKDQDGKFGFEEGIEKLLGFEWDKMSDDFLEPKITPVLEITNEFRNTANEMRQLLGLSALEEGLIPNNNINMNVPEDFSGLQNHDYTENFRTIGIQLDTLNNNMDQFKMSLKGMRFVINGRRFAETIGPDMDTYLAESGAYAARANLT